MHNRERAWSSAGLDLWLGCSFWPLLSRDGALTQNSEDDREGNANPLPDRTDRTPVPRLSRSRIAAVIAACPARVAATTARIASAAPAAGSPV